MFHSYGGHKNLIVTDLNILPSQLHYALNNFNSVTIFDHHPSSADFIALEEISDKFEIYFSEEVCATTLVQTYMMEQGHEFTETEKKFFRYVNLYDIWKNEHKEFIYGRMANDLFWYYGWTHFLGKLKKNGVFDIPSGLEHKELQHCKKVFDDIQHVKQTAEWFNTDCGSTIVILEHDQKVAINHVSELFDSQTGIYYIMYFGGVYRCSSRVGNNHRGNYDLGGSLKEFIKESDPSANGGGHAAAAGMAFERGVKLGPALKEIERFDTYIFENLE